MIHTILYLGRYSDNFDRLRSHTGRVGTFKRIDAKGNECPIDPPSEKVDGIVFGYMEKGYEGLSTKEAFYAVAVKDTVLETPIPLVPDRHTDGKRIGPSAPQFGSNSARVLLKDIIARNPSQAAELQAIYRNYFGPLQSAASPEPEARA